MPHCPTCQQHPGVWKILKAAFFARKGKRFECSSCERAVVVPVWQRKVAWCWLLVPLGPLVWARWFASVVRPGDATMARPSRRSKRGPRRKQELL